MLDPPVAAVDRFGNRIEVQQQKRVPHLLGQQALVVFDRQHVVGFLGDDLLGDLALATHGIDGHHGPSQLQRIEQLGNGRDFIGFFLHLALPEHQVVGAGPGRNQMHELLHSDLARAA